MNQSIEQEILSLPSKTLPELRRMWKELFKKEAPPYCRKYLIPKIAYRKQEMAYGNKTAKELDRLADLLEQGKKISSDKLPRAGTKFIREYNGRDHEVLVTDTGFIYEGQFFTSLSAIANKITGISRNGPEFFGLRDKKRSQERVGGKNE